MSQREYIDCTGMSEYQRTVTMLAAILKYITLPKRNVKAKIIRERSRREERARKRKKRWRR